MKNIIYIAVALLIFSCSNEEHRKRINCEFKGGVILHKYNFKEAKIGDECYSIQYKGEVYPYVSVYDIDSDYEVGDTINKPCLNN